MSKVFSMPSTQEPQRHPLELKIPPPIVALLLAGIMWGVSRLTPLTEVPAIPRYAATGTLAAIGIALAVSGVLTFRFAKTTILPDKPERASALVSTGVYRVSRNPMYLGLLLLLCAWAVWRSAPWGLLVPLAFFLYINRFQIVPEERVLSAKFGTDYKQYTARVRRWV
jgi:protein-S-isoprenylcysteine O-methyltransferase Ste14